MADQRLRRELRSLEKGMRQYQRQAGQFLQWFQMDYADTTSDPIYSTGPTRVWLPPITVPALNAWIEEQPQRFEDTALYVVDRLNAVLSVDQIKRAGLTMLTFEHHLNDRVVYDSETFSIDSFIPDGRVADVYTVIAISGAQVKPEELVTDAPPPGGSWPELVGD